MTRRESPPDDRASDGPEISDASTHSRDPIRVAYADPPYPGQAKRHYGKQGDPFEGDVAEVDHAALIADLERQLAVLCRGGSLGEFGEIARGAAEP